MKFPVVLSFFFGKRFILGIFFLSSQQVSIVLTQSISLPCRGWLIYGPGPHLHLSLFWEPLP
jgi:hypothetical protein